MRHLRVLLLVLLLPGCNHPLPAPSPVNPAPKEALDQDPSSSTSCKFAESRLIALGCKDSQGRLLGGPNKAGDTFHEICENAAANQVDLHPACLAAAKSCEEVSACSR